MAVNPSEEQLGIISSLLEGKNVLTDSVAGSGKTTTILFLAKAAPKKKIIVVTYNSRLKAETRERVKKNGLKNIDVHSYHSLGLQHYTNPCNTDTHLMNIVKHNMKAHPSPQADILILDESQDMTKNYFDFLVKVIRDINNSNLQLFIMGDYMQCIYEFLGADSRFLTLADKIFTTSRPWDRHHLKTSYRITKPMEWFVNDVVLGYPRMKSIKKIAIPVKYYTGDPFNKVPMALAKELQVLFSSGLMHSDVFILAPSIKSPNPWNPVKKFENLLVRMGIPCYVPLSDDEELRDDIIRDKLVFSSMHQSKGLERKVVIVMNFSTSFYFVFKTAPQEICPNLIYVAATRASEMLYVWGESEKEKPLPFLKHHLLTNNPHFQRIDIESTKQESRSSTSPKEYTGMDLRSVTQLTRFLQEESLQQILELCKIVVRKQAGTSIEIPCIISTTGNKKESVSDLNGIAIPTIYEHRKTGQMSIQTDLETNFVSVLRGNGNITAEQKEWIAIIQKEPKSPEDYLKLSNIYSAYVSGYIFKISQIKNYDWLTHEQIELLLHVLESNIHGNPQDMFFEETLELQGYAFNNREIHVQGRADLIDDTTLWELKCVDSLKPEHIVQLALYAYLWQETEYKEKGRRRFCLLNIRTGEVQEITGIQNLKMIMDIVLDNAFRTVNKISDEEFIEICLAGPETKMVRATDSECMILDD